MATTLGVGSAVMLESAAVFFARAALVEASVLCDDPAYRPELAHLLAAA